MTANVSRTKAALSPLPELGTYSSTLRLAPSHTHTCTLAFGAASRRITTSHICLACSSIASQELTRINYATARAQNGRNRERENKRKRERVQERCSNGAAAVAGNCCHMTFDLASHWRIYNLKQVANKADERPNDTPTERRKRSYVQTYVLVAYIHTYIHTSVWSIYPPRIWRSCQYQSSLWPLLTATAEHSTYVPGGVYVCVCVRGVSVSAGVSSVLCLHCAINSVEISALAEVIKTIITA